MKKEYLELNEYQDFSKRTRNKGLTKNEELANYGMGLVGETGEVIDLLKKVVFHGHDFEKEKLKDELGDVLWYLANLATTLEINLQEIAEYNIAKLQKRYPGGFDEERSKNRAEFKEELYKIMDDTIKDTDFLGKVVDEINKEMLPCYDCMEYKQLGKCEVCEHYEKCIKLKCRECEFLSECAR